MAGYWTAWLWQIYNQTKDTQFKEAAEKHFDAYNWRFNNDIIHCHDIGVNMDFSDKRKQLRISYMSIYEVPSTYHDKCTTLV